MLMTPRRVDVLLSVLCQNLGFCLPPAEQARLQEEPPSDVDAFTDAIFVAEGMPPDGDLHLRRQVRAVVAKHFWQAETDDLQAS
jgi:hypothetical protein